MIERISHPDTFRFFKGALVDDIGAWIFFQLDLPADLPKDMLPWDVAIPLLRSSGFELPDPLSLENLHQEAGWHLFAECPADLRLLNTLGFLENSGDDNRPLSFSLADETRWSIDIPQGDSEFFSLS